LSQSTHCPVFNIRYSLEPLLQAQWCVSWHPFPALWLQPGIVVLHRASNPQSSHTSLHLILNPCVCGVRVSELTPIQLVGSLQVAIIAPKECTITATPVSAHQQHVWDRHPIRSTPRSGGLSTTHTPPYPPSKLCLEPPRHSLTAVAPSDYTLNIRRICLFYR